MVIWATSASRVCVEMNSTLSTSRDENNVVPQVNNSESERVEERDKGATEKVNGQQEVSDLNVNASCVEQAGYSHLPDKAVNVGDENN